MLSERRSLARSVRDARARYRNGESPVVDCPAERLQRRKMALFARCVRRRDLRPGSGVWRLA